MSPSSGGLCLFGRLVSAMCTSRSRPGSAAGAALSIGASGAELCAAGAAAVVVSGALAGCWRAGVLALPAAAPSPPEERPSSPAKARRSLASSLSQIASNRRRQLSEWAPPSPAQFRQFGEKPCCESIAQVM